MSSPPHVRAHIPERVEFQAGVWIAPLRTPTLKPATHTNCYVVGEEELVVIDPGSPWPEEQEKLARFCRELQGEGRRFREIWLSHEHPDHVGGAEALRRQLKVPVRAHPATCERLPREIQLGPTLNDNEVLELSGALGLRLRAVFTPGHARGHLCFFEERSGALFAGDMVAGVGSIVVNPPEGDMSDYIASLRRLAALPVGTLYPAHGPVIPFGLDKIAEYLEHRAQRERRVLSALKSARKVRIETLLALVYPEIPKSVYPLAARSLEAILDKLRKEGQVAVDEAGGFILLTSS